MSDAIRRCGRSAAEDRDRAAVGQPGRGGEGAARVLDHGVSRPVSTSRTRIRGRKNRSASAAPAGRDREAGPVRAPGHLGDPGRQVGEPAAVAGRGVDEPDLAPAVLREAAAVLLEVEPVDEAVVARRRRAGLRVGRLAPRSRIGRAIRSHRARQDGERRAVGRPLEAVDAARQVGQPARLARAGHRQEVDLDAVLAVCGDAGLLLDQRAPIGQEGELPAVGRPARVEVAARAERELARGLVAVRRRDPDRARVAIERRAARAGR